MIVLCCVQNKQTNKQHRTRALSHTTAACVMLFVGAVSGIINAGNKFVKEGGREGVQLERDDG